MASDRARPVLSLRALRKSYGGAVVLDDLDLDVWPGEVHAILGENGAGKSTLIKVIAGVVVPDGGRVTIGGAALPFGSPRAAMAAGVATLFQELATVGGLSVAENVFLGRVTPSWRGVVRWGPLDAAARALFAELGQDIDVRLDADRLTPVEKTMTALARALSVAAPLLILDEPTAALTDAETARLFAAVRRLQARGVAILYVSHRLEEVLTLADRYTVLRNGLKVASGNVPEATVEGIIAAMAGRPIEAVFPEWHGAPGATVLRCEGLTGRKVEGVDLELRSGEVVGLAGLAGAGRSELLGLIGGTRRPRAGWMWLDDRPFAPGSVAAAQAVGVVLVPQERRSQALVPDSVERNLNLTTIADHALAGVVTSPARERAHARALWDEIGVRGRSIDQEVLTLSGGNQQKVVLARFMALRPRVLLLDEPTRGVDVSTKQQVYGLIRNQAMAGCAVLMVSSELPEVMGLCDRIIVLHEGRTSGRFERSEVGEEELLHACYGRSA